MRSQLALNVPDIDAAVAYYSKLFGAEPYKRRDGYANFTLDCGLTSTAASSPARSTTWWERSC